MSREVAGNGESFPAKRPTDMAKAFASARYHWKYPVKIILFLTFDYSGNWRNPVNEMETSRSGQAQTSASVTGLLLFTDCGFHYLSKPAR